ncbi:hypothetical protein [Dictyobacter formicarum]|uniref:Uncharacterized protein n=1 Tax=Dictyobacter formicarum TaxID=2778368 RepID=A0ABQ3VEU8_9CHLR|nr:hypothetical protein [Dictyobacter formicarum]GHO84259.1 hypothetical protein KSZ_22650 [Dictyobacter formicarum]
MLKAVAAALVLIAGAAVVLWYANTLNSWVLGGLIGGLAALLLSIPISLTLFSFLARRHEEQERARLQDEEYKEASRSVMYEYRQVPERLARTILIEEEDEYIPRKRGIWGEEEEYVDERRYLPAPTRRELPPPSSRNSASDAYPAYRPSSTQRGRPTPRQLAPRDIESPSRRHTTRRLPNTGFPGYQTDMTRSKFQSQALRIARQEASQRSEEAAQDDYQGYRSRRPSSSLTNNRPDQRSSRKPPSSHGYRQNTRQFQDTEPSYQYSSRGRRIVDANLSPNSPSRVFSENEDLSAQKYQYRDPETDVFQQDFVSSDLKKPLQRRAPYMYEDDALKDELAQQLEPPTTRRSSRNLASRHDEE